MLGGTCVLSLIGNQFLIGESIGSYWGKLGSDWSPVIVPANVGFRVMHCVRVAHLGLLCFLVFWDLQSA